MEAGSNAKPLEGARWLVYAGLFLAIAVMWQSLRFFVPWLTGPWNVFLIGSLVKATLALAVLVTRRQQVAVIALVLPLVAFLQGQLPLLPLVPVVGLGSCVYMLLAWRWWGTRLVWLVPLLSAAVFYGGTRLMLSLFSLPEPLARGLLLMLSWPQVVTGCAGILLAGLVYQRVAGLVSK